MPRRGRAQGEDGARAGAARGPTAVQWLTGAAAMAAIAAALAWAPRLALSGLHRGLLVVFGLGVLWRLAALAARPRATPAPDLPDAELPRYTVIAPLYQEGAVAAQLIANLSRLDYPADRLQVLVALEADDHATRAAVQAAGPPPFVQVVLAPAAGPAHQAARLQRRPAPRHRRAGGDLRRGGRAPPLPAARGGRPLRRGGRPAWPACRRRCASCWAAAGGWCSASSPWSTPPCSR